MVLIVEQILLISNKTVQKTGEYTCWHVYLSALLRPWCIDRAIVRSIHPGRGLRFCCNYRKDEVNKFFIIWHLIVVDQSLRSIKTNNWSADNLKKKTCQLNEFYTQAHNTLRWHWSADTLFDSCQSTIT